jgi:hypothetical protein
MSRFGLLGTALVSAAVLRGQGNDNQFTRPTLRGLVGVGVDISESIKPEIRQASITEKVIRADVERMLRTAGIRVLALNELESVPGTPVLCVTASMSAVTPTSYVYCVITELRQGAALHRDPSIPAVASTWMIYYYGTFDKSRVDNLRTTVRKSVDRFTNALALANMLN